MTTSLIIFCIISAIITYFSINRFITLAPKFGLMDIPNHRSSHVKHTPRGAGIVFGLIFLIALFIFEIQYFSEIKYTLLSILVIYIGGFLDDKYTLSSLKKLIFIVVASVIAYFSGFQLDYIGTFFSYDFSLGYISILGTIFVIVALTNSINLSDGLDGLAGSLSIIILTCLFIIGFIHDDHILIVWPAILISILMAFLLLNWHPAKVFMGDSGSLLLGFVISILSIHAIEFINPLSILFLAAVPVLDTLIVFRRRIQRGKSPFSADKNHLHHILNNIKQDKAYTVKMLLLMQLSFAVIFLQIYEQDEFLNLVTFVLLFLVFFNLFDPRAKKRPKDARLRKKYEKEKEKKKILKEKLGLMKKKKEGTI
ncbi:MAG: undecaprenyl-phosphate alpha-N-acetylglucosaminyl 1-phosphate transferase [Arcobacter sp.]|nr:undecaprenyl-phosphate alpha-N-acetylglucosaminyl 1-phosphate transferase [Arcobacter sp.]